MKIEPINYSDISFLSKLGTNSFFHDEFYINYRNKGAQGRDKLNKLFIKSITICIKYGIAQKVVVNGQPQAFLLAFNYKAMKTEHPKEFNHFFGLDEHNMTKTKLVSICNALEKSMNDDCEYLYILTIAVNKVSQNQGIATKMLTEFCNDNSGFSFITDVSNSVMGHICEKFGFCKSDSKIEGCKIYTKHHAGLSTGFNRAHILVAIPQGSDFLDGYKRITTTTIPGICPIQDSPLFLTDIGNASEADIYKVDPLSLLKFQAYIGISNCIENSVVLCSMQASILYYVSSKEEQIDKKHIKLIDITNDCQTDEKNLIVDIYSGIPMTYRDNTILNKDLNLKNCFFASKILSALSFRTRYESGIPVANLCDNGFKERIKRIYLGKIKVQLKAEETILFDSKYDPVYLGDSFEVMMILSADIESSICVLHLIALSYDHQVTQYLDSLSRNQIEVVLSNGELQNIFQYLESTYKLSKSGTTKNFVTIFEEKNNIRKELLASMLFCETYYANGESLGTIVDDDILEMINSNHGTAQYDYADVIMGSNIAIQMSPKLLHNIEQRIIIESTTLFYIELVLFEESAVSLADTKIRRALSSIIHHTPNSILKSFGEQLQEYASSIDFWNVQMNYPSSKVAVDNIRKYFRIDDLLKRYKRDQEIFQKLYESRSDYTDRRESIILTTIGAVLTTISVLEMVWNTAGYVLLSTAGIIVGVLLIIKNKFLLKSKKQDKRKKN